MTLKILDGEFFEVKETKGNNVLAECVTCKKLVRGNKFSSSNFRSHLKRHHGDSMLTAYENRVKDVGDDRLDVSGVSDSSSDQNDTSDPEEKNHQQGSESSDEEDLQTKSEEDSQHEGSVSDQGSEMSSNVETDDSSTSTHCCHCRKRLNRRTSSRTNYCTAKKRDILDGDLSKFRVVEDDSGYPRRFFIRVDK